MRRLILMALPLSLGGCLPQNPGLESQHPPIVTEGHATVHGCPDWSSQGVDSAAGTDSNYGCATNANIAAMIAHPSDIDHGAAARTGDSSDIAARTVSAWRTGAAAARSPSGGAAASGAEAATPKGQMQ